MGQPCRQPSHHRERLRFDGLLEHIVLSVGFEHDRELDVADLVDDAVIFKDPETVRSGIRHCAMKPASDHIHRAEHVTLLETDLDMNAADLGALLVVGGVVWAGEKPFEPMQQRRPESLDLGFALEDRPGAGVLADGLVETIYDAQVIGLNPSAQRLQASGALGVEPHVVQERREQAGVGHPAWLRNCNRSVKGWQVATPSKGGERGQPDHAHRTGSVRGEPPDIGWIELVRSAGQLNTKQNQIDARTLGALQDVVRPMPLFVELCPTANPPIGAPLTLPLEELTLLPKPGLYPVAPTVGIVTHRGGRLGAPAPTAPIG